MPNFLSILRQFTNRYFANPGYRSKTNAEGVLSALKAAQNGVRGLLSGGGWSFLINDTNDFLSWQLGVNRWSAGERAAVRKMMAERARALGVPYVMLITPEKSVAYREWLPEDLSRLRDAPDRPAKYLATHFPEVIYPTDYLEKMKRHGFLYYRSDTHVNWLGSFLLYRHLIDAINARGINVGTGIPLNSLLPSLAGWEGDVMSQSPEASAEELSLWKPMYLNEALVQYTLPERGRKASRLAEPDVFRIDRPERETIVTINADSSLPRALVFRDSTATLMVDLLAEHFSRAVFVWPAVDDPDKIESMARQEKPDLVLHLKAERFVSAYSEMESLRRADSISECGERG